MMKLMNVDIRINGEHTSLEIKPNETLLETLRNRMELTGAKEGCGLGACGSCTVLVDGKPMRSCITLTAEVAGSDVVTIEGLAEGDSLHPLQESFMDKGAVQCGFCTSGMIMTAKGLLDRNSQPTRQEIVKTISSNVCRCTGYKKIVEAVEAVAKKTK
ncbi:MAG: (2Fe-2S)-binding protein [Desulfomonilaceae bacterium]